MSKQAECVFCGGLAETKDHIPSKNLFKGIKAPKKYIKVPSCLDCNKGFSKDEEYFRNLIASIRYKDSLTATYLLDTAIARSIRKRPSLAISMFKNMDLVDVYTPAGIYLDKKTRIKMSKETHKRVFNILDKYVKGLFFHHFRQNLPGSWVIKHDWLTPKLETKISGLLQGLRWEVVSRHVFIYGFNYVPKTHQSVWCWVFFGKALFCSFVLDEKTVKKIETSRKPKSSI